MRKGKGAEPRGGGERRETEKGGERRGRVEEERGGERRKARMEKGGVLGALLVTQTINNEPTGDSLRVTLGKGEGKGVRTDLLFWLRTGSWDKTQGLDRRPRGCHQT